MSFLISQGGQLSAGGANMSAAIKRAKELATPSAPAVVYQPMRVIRAETKLIVEDYVFDSHAAEAVQP